MPISRRIAVLVLAATLWIPAAAPAQAPAPAQPPPGEDSGSSRPPVDLGGGEDGAKRDAGARDAPRSSELPNTGSDPRMLILAGAALTLIGVGLRLRTADAGLY